MLDNIQKVAVNVNLIVFRKVLKKHLAVFHSFIFIILVVVLDESSNTKPRSSYS